MTRGKNVRRAKHDNGQIRFVAARQRAASDIPAAAASQWLKCRQDHRRGGSDRSQRDVKGLVLNLMG